MPSKELLLAQIEQAHAIANQLYKQDRDFYQPLFAWINGQARRRVSPAVILEVLKAIEREHRNGHRPRDIHEYLGGIARSIKEHNTARDLRSGQTNSITEILGRAMAAATGEDRSKK